MNEITASPGRPEGQWAITDQVSSGKLPLQNGKPKTSNAGAYSSNIHNNGKTFGNGKGKNPTRNGKKK